jgi:UPF0755 protein
MKKFLISLLFLLASFSAGFVFVYSQTKPVSKDTSAKYFLILKGTSASEVASQLKEAGLIRSPFLFKAYTQFTGSAKKIQAGQYKLYPNYSLFKVISEIGKGPIEVWVTIPEGLRREQIAEKYISVLKPPDPEGFRTDFLSLTKTKEGYLFPDTYLFPWDASPSMIVAKMLATFDQKINKITLEQLTVASLLERETVNDVEKGIVAGIIYKRLKAGWPLQIDSAVQYASATLRCQNNLDNCSWWQPVTKDDLVLNSKFNTYKFKGLPPAPIADAGFASLKAAIAPEDSPYWFYIHDSGGTIHYAKTLEEHNLNIGKYLR